MSKSILSNNSALAGGSEPDSAAHAAYRDQLFCGVPLYTTRLVQEGSFSFAERDRVCTPEGIAVVLQDYFSGRDREECVLCLLDTAGTLIGLSQLSVGGLASSIVEPRQVFKTAMLANAASVIVAHNHVSGNPEPSQEDIRITRRLVEVGQLMGIRVLDHLIIHDAGYTSLAEQEVLR